MLRSLLRVGDLSPDDLAGLLERTAEIKACPRDVPRVLVGDTVTLSFEKPSTRTRIAFETAVVRLGGHPVVITPASSQAGRGESLEDTVRAVERYARAFIVRTFHDADLARYHAASRIPIVNALTDGHHPCQAIADLFTLRERFGSVRGLRIAYVGAGNNVLHSLIEACALGGVDLAVATPPELGPDPAIVALGERLAATSGARLVVVNDPDAAVRGCNAVYTDTWLSMGDPEDERAARLAALARFRVDARLLSLADPRAVFLHCLPAHRGEEVTDDVADGAQSIVFDQAENKLHSSIAILEALLETRLEGARSATSGTV